MNSVLPPAGVPPPEFLTEGEARRLIQLVHRRRDGGTVAQLVAARRGEGTSCLARDLFLVAAKWPGCRVLLLDLNAPGTGQADWLRARLPPTVEMLLGRGFAFLGFEATSPFVSEFRGAHPMELGIWPKVMPKLREAFDLVLVDSPAMEVSYDAVTVAPAVDATLLVVAAEATPAAEVRHARDRLFDAGGTVAGSILNKRREHVPALLRGR
jgi:Mrp family chromosome partitioning ATPase